MFKQKYFKIILTFLFLLFFIILTINIHIKNTTKEYIYNDLNKIPSQQTGLILGARVYKNGKMSDMLLDRVKTGVELYKNKKIKKILVSGDHGQKEYDEVNTIKNYLLKNKIPPKDIFLDHAGFDTYDSIYRAKNIFEVESLIIITQNFHLPRAIYIGQKLNIPTSGIIADKQKYLNIEKNEMRENLARIKAFLNVIFKSQPKFLGEKIPINGDNSLSWD